LAKSRRQSGFTLIELMVTVAIVAVLAAVSYPSYQSHLRKGRRAQAEAYLMDLAQRQQQYLTDNRAYALDAGTVTASTTLNAPVPADVVSNYTITTAARAGVTPSFIVTATAIGKQVADGNLTIDETGAKTPSGKW
jgi:type IV pilus assembly protein PilE